jgi:uncharacterized protein with FMN-binding domain
MRTPHKLVIGGGCAAIVAVGFVAAPPFTVATTDPNPDPTTSADPTSGGQTFDGPAVSNARGTYQAQITVEDGKVTDVIALQAGTQDPNSIAVNQVAIPAFKAEVLEAQTWDVTAVSGASFTSPAFIESLQGAFEAAGLP